MIDKKNIQIESKKFPPRGLTYFWFLNDECKEAELERQIDEFTQAKVSTICLHPRDGLLFPYGGNAWFEMIAKTTSKLATAGISVWLYDEFPYPSGNAGGRIVIDYPEFRAAKITMHQASSEDIKDCLWCFPAAGPLLYCGLVSKENGFLIEDYTHNVGVLTREWKVMKDWDSRFYYPATPLYTCDRAMTSGVEYAIKVKDIPEKYYLVAFTTENALDISSRWQYNVDPLNPQATQKYIEYTHEKYYKHMGDMFGKEVTAMFTDEPKYYGKTPFTPGMFESFYKNCGYELKDRLYHLFAKTNTPEGIQTRLNYREWCGKRFEEAWMKPVAKWCHEHQLKLVGHISPEDDPVTQACCVSNLMPLQKHFDLCGLDIIIPAIGDGEHPLLNIGIISAVSVAQQEKKIGVLSESLACSGNNCSMKQLRRIINWQTIMGMTVPVVHGIFSSLKGNREFECPPDYGPNSKYWEGMQELSKDIESVQEIISGAVQIAPVAILWPIRSFYDLNEFWQADHGGLRDELMTLVSTCVQEHIGIQFIDEDTFQQVREGDSKLITGNAQYSHIIVPGSTIWDDKTLRKLDSIEKNGKINVYYNATIPVWRQNKNSVDEINLSNIQILSIKDIKTKLPKLAEISCKKRNDIFVSSWLNDGKKFLLLYYPGKDKISVCVNNKQIELSDHSILVI